MRFEVQVFDTTKMISHFQFDSLQLRKNQNFIFTFPIVAIQTHQCCPVIPLTRYWIDKDQLAIEGIPVPGEDAPGCSWKHPGTRVAAVTLFPK